MCSVSAPCAVGHESACEQCGERFSRRTHHGKKQRFCGLQCSNRAQADAANARNARECETCGKTFRRRNPNAATARDAGKYCSKKCYGAAKSVALRIARLPVDLGEWFYSWDCAGRRVRNGERLAADKAAALAAKVCERCGKSNPKPHSQYCSRECSHPAGVVQCRTCGCNTVGKLGRRSNCKECNRQARRARKGKHRKRCQRRGLPYDPRVNLARLMKRDRCVCQLCGVKVLRKFTWHIRPLLGEHVPDERSPTIDHIIPLGNKSNTQHGHTMDNTQLACWKCNTDKRDAMPVDRTEAATIPAARQTPPGRGPALL